MIVPLRPLTIDASISIFRHPQSTNIITMLNINSVLSGGIVGCLFLKAGSSAASAVRGGSEGDDGQPLSSPSPSPPRRWNEFKILEGHTQPDNYHSPLPHE
jgi:hypothetical protein